VTLVKRNTLIAVAPLARAVSAPAQSSVPRFEPDAYWPKPLQNHWMLGQVSGIYVDSHDDIWVTNRPRSLDNGDKYGALDLTDCCSPAPPVLEFDQAGNFVQGWGGPNPGYEWRASRLGCAR
jgi:hypothetical protein